MWGGGGGYKSGFGYCVKHSALDKAKFETAVLGKARLVPTVHPLGTKSNVNQRLRPGPMWATCCNAVKKRNRVTDK
jgi:hypothetical protein